MLAFTCDAQQAFWSDLVYTNGFFFGYFFLNGYLVFIRTGIISVTGLTFTGIVKEAFFLHFGIYQNNRFGITGSENVFPARNFTGLETFLPARNYTGLENILPARNREILRKKYSGVGNLKSFCSNIRLYGNISLSSLLQVLSSESNVPQLGTRHEWFMYLLISDLKNRYEQLNQSYV